jgi:hypothetical protein
MMGSCTDKCSATMIDRLTGLGETRGQPGERGGEMAATGKVLYSYSSAACGKRGEERLDDDSHDGEASICAFCGARVTLEWDGGVTFETPKTIADDGSERARQRQ